MAAAVLRSQPIVGLRVGVPRPPLEASHLDQQSLFTRPPLSQSMLKSASVKMLPPPFLPWSMPAPPERVREGFSRGVLAAGSGAPPPNPQDRDPATWSSKELGEYLAEKLGLSEIKSHVIDAGITGVNIHTLRARDLKAWGLEPRLQARMYCFIEALVRSELPASCY